ncbi:hypothetical protein C499_15495 [Halogeometricum borinquense DSM 11551]|uniref:Uncharacterized protein n=2 Tax=Halogeometricum borinquense TaxID=60847 RepID=E4NSP8_HALBP|nr:hypothetical protein [Halogeometricum borinquense]ADQ68141.1 hypothetical protein Hbor_25880 [Halogeometricum borinquense DSM 11551]ELY24815.1 hypothetical protein C499_15495 [Halogeometricum borinquense DSM 11551]RYJ12956.1 hypothetical protein ELS19_02545 [Halogeometricum borinquense]
MHSDRAQLATPLIEVTVGIFLILAVALGFALLPVETEETATLDRTASDALSVLAAEPPEGTGPNRIAAACRSESAFETEADELDSRLRAILPDPLSYRLATPQGHVGQPRPSGIPAGTASFTTDGCTVTLWVWYV